MVIFECIISAIILLFLSISDYLTWKVSNKYILIFAGIAILFFTLEAFIVKAAFFVVERLLLVAGLFAFGYLRVIGMGDIKACMVLALLNDPLVVIFSVFIACIFVVLRAIISNPKEQISNLADFTHMLLITKSIKKRSSSGKRVPFIPYLFASYITVWLIFFFLI